MERIDTARDCVVDNLILPYPVDPVTDAFLDRQMKGKRTLDRPELTRLAVQGAATDTVAHTYGRQVPPGGFWSVSDWVELARIPSTYGQVTILRQIETTLTDPQGRAFIKNTTQIFDDTAGEFWLLYTDENFPNQRIFSLPYGGGSLPGTPVKDFTRWSDNRFQWGNTQSITIPLLPGYNVSLFYYWNFGGIVNQSHIWDDTGEIHYRPGEVVLNQDDNTYYVCTVEHDSALVLRPNNPGGAFVWVAISNAGFTEWYLNIAGRLVASKQSEKNLNALAQTTQTFKI